MVPALVYNWQHKEYPLFLIWYLLPSYFQQCMKLGTISDYNCKHKTQMQDDIIQWNKLFSIIRLRCSHKYFHPRILPTDHACDPGPGCVKIVILIIIIPRTNSVSTTYILINISPLQEMSQISYPLLPLTLDIWNLLMHHGKPWPPTAFSPT